jgi:Na+-translocating ferredoxin:NAD+ oxidoreductase RnfC subunit
MTQFDTTKQGLVGCYLPCAEACPSSIEHRDVQKRDQTGIHHNSATPDPEPSRDRMTTGSGLKIEAKMGQRSQLSHAAVNAQKRRGEETGEAEGAEGSRGWGSRDQRTRARASMGCT